MDVLSACKIFFFCSTYLISDLYILVIFTSFLHEGQDVGPKLTQHLCMYFGI